MYTIQKPECRFSQNAGDDQLKNPLLKRVSGLRFACVSQFTLESGITLKNVAISYKALGHLNASGDNAIIICHPMIGHPDFCTWWEPLTSGKDHVLDADKYFIICLTWLGSPYGSAGPLTARDGDPKLGSYGPDFPIATIRDDVNIHRIVVEGLGVKQIAAVIGPSVGGMHALEWAYFGPKFVQRVASISSSSKNSAYSMAWTEMLRQCIFSDPNFKDGHYRLESPPLRGLALVWMNVITQGRTPEHFEANFGRAGCRGTTLFSSGSNEMPSSVNHEGLRWLQSSPPIHFEAAGNRTEKAKQYKIESQNSMKLEDFMRRFSELFAREHDANSMITILRKIDTHDVSRGRVPRHIEDPQEQIKMALRLIEQQTLIVGVPGDLMFPYSGQLEQATSIPNSEIVRIDTVAGHEMFIQKGKQMNEILSQFLSKPPESLSLSPKREQSMSKL